ncbi:ribosomal biogenesis protein LAS1L [Aplysia californica]|uniref:Ribosomal biogenesis protein LAS1L n=1 Tax=Aplysia californica TaxID=6500 RepID=A0ABM0JRR1_APLCA|nr:ribosomal biogenesis protein LAS1L [Aplysia californica]
MRFQNNKRDKIVSRIKMAAPLMSLPSSGSIKHVVPWRSRQEFLGVYENLFNEDVSQQNQAINRIATWKSRAGNKLSVAIESSAHLLQVCLDYRTAKAEGSLQEKDAQLRSSCGLALIRFVNHVTEKAQTKAVAQPVHLIAREFGIPEWLVRMRHDATHGTMPCLDALVTGVKWALAYLNERFWQQQLEDQTEDRATEQPEKKFKMADVRTAMYDFQKARYQELNSGTDEEKKEKEKEHQNNILQTLQSYLSRNRLQFIKCFLEDGILISTEEQLAAFGVQTEDLLAHSPPTMPVEVTEFWRPLLQKLYSSGALPLLMNTALFSTTPEPGLRNYQLVAWLVYLLSQSTDSTLKGKRKRRRKEEDLVKGPMQIPKKTLLAACLQNVNSYSIHLFKYLADRESLGASVYEKLMKLLDINSVAAGGEGASDESDTDNTVYTVEDLKSEKLKKVRGKTEPPPSVENVQNSIEKQDIPWTICTDIIDWSTVPFGVIPDPASLENEADGPDGDVESHREDHVSDNEDDEEEDDSKEYRGEKKKRRQSATGENDDKTVSPKRSTYVVKEDLL